MRALRAAMIVWLHALLALFAFPSLPAPSYAAPDQCGVWRWPLLKGPIESQLF